MEQYLTYIVNNEHFAVAVEMIERVVRVVTIQSVAQSSTHCAGVINVEGVMVPVVNLRTLLSYPKKEIELTDILIIFRLEEARFALLVDAIGNAEFGEQQEGAESEMIPLPGAFEYMVKLKEEVIPVYDLKKLFASVEQACESQTAN